MNNIRLLPLVIVATSALFVLRGISVLSDGQFDAFGTGTSIAQQADAEETASILKDQRTETQAAAIEEAQTENVMDATTPLTAQNTESTAPNIPDFSQKEVQALRRSGISDAEIKVLVRLRERREQLASRERQLELRESMLKAMESSLKTKLETLDNGGSAGGELAGTNDPQKPNERVKQLVTMYEAMKPKDAARILSRLDTNLLADLARAMNPRRMSAIMAAMDGDAAERLTLALAGSRSASQDLASLPKVGAGGLSQ
jgi:flagellar motility protein MotE (MotC chaperone)